MQECFSTGEKLVPQVLFLMSHINCSSQQVKRANRLKCSYFSYVTNYMTFLILYLTFSICLKTRLKKCKS